MPTLTTVNVTSRSTLIFGGQGSNATPIQIVNLDTANTVYLAYASNLVIGQPGVIPIGPLASMSFDGAISIYGITGIGQTVEISVIPGGSNYSPGSLTITGPVNAEITGPVTVEGTVDIGNTPSVEISGTPTVDIANTPSVIISGTPTVDVGTVSGSIDIASVAGSVNVAGAVNATGVGGFITPGQIVPLFTNNTAITAGPGAETVVGTFNVSTIASLVFGQFSLTVSSVAAGAPVCAVWFLIWMDANGNGLCTDTVSAIIGSDVTWEIPVKGAQVQVLLINVGTVGTITVPVYSGGTSGIAGLNLDGSFRDIPNTRVVFAIPGNSGFIALTGCTVVTQANPVFQVGPWVASIAFTWSAAAANVVFPLPQWVGAVTGFYQVITTALVKVATIVDLTYAVQGGVVSGTAYRSGTSIIQSMPSAIGSGNLAMNMPPTQCAIIIDTPATAGTFSIGLVGVAN
jgi:hypothetical protein